MKMFNKNNKCSCEFSLMQMVMKSKFVTCNKCGKKAEYNSELGEYIFKDGKPSNITYIA